MPGLLSPTAPIDTAPGVLVYDVNAPWREKVFEALGTFRPVVGIAPKVGWRGRHFNRAPIRYGGQIGYRRLEIPALPGWARKLYRLHRPYFWRLGQRALKSLGGIGSVIITIPHHWPLIKIVDPPIKRIYYCPDYYEAYHGWDPQWTREAEINIVKEVDAVFVVSQALRHHFISLVPEATQKIRVVPNGVDPKFLADEPAVEPLDLPFPNVRVQRPLIGCVGVLNSRIDYRLLRRVVDSSKKISLILVGPMETLTDNALEIEREFLLAHPRVILAGPQPHESLPKWLRAMDILLIPYTGSIFNYMCSPLRLFDYLASGRPIIGTTACSQLSDYKDLIHLADNSDAFCLAVDAATKTACQKELCYKRWLFAKNCLWLNRATNIHDNINLLNLR